MEQRYFDSWRSNVIQIQRVNAGQGNDQYFKDLTRNSYCAAVKLLFLCHCLQNNSEISAQLSLNSEYLPAFVASHENNYQLMGENVFCNEAHHSKQGERNNTE